MFDALGQRFTKLFSGLRGKVSQAQLNEFATDIKSALLDSDVALSVADSFSNQILESLRKTQMRLTEVRTLPKRYLRLLINN